MRPRSGCSAPCRAASNGEQPIIHHPATYYEMTRYVSNEDGTYGPSRRSGHDDTVIAFGIAIMTIVTERPDAGPTPAHLGHAPPYTPGQTPPRLSQAYGRTFQMPGESPAAWDDDAMVGIDMLY